MPMPPPPDLCQILFGARMVKNYLYIYTYIIYNITHLFTHICIHTCNVKSYSEVLGENRTQRVGWALQPMFLWSCFLCMWLSGSYFRFQSCLLLLPSWFAGEEQLQTSLPFFQSSEGCLWRSYLGRHSVGCLLRGSALCLVGSWTNHQFIQVSFQCSQLMLTVGGYYIYLFFKLQSW